MITYKLGRVKGELNGIPPETDGGPNRAEYTQNAFADLHSEKIG
jgi:hypothetical protein